MEKVSHSESLPSLPPLRPASGRGVLNLATLQPSEGTRVVGTAKKADRPRSSSGSAPSVPSADEAEGAAVEPPDPAKWTHQRLATEGVEKTKVGWENEIARHILSVYASTNAQKNLKESHSLLDFVGDKAKRKAPAARPADDDQLVYSVPQFHRNYNDHVQRLNLDAEHGHTKHHRRMAHAAGDADATDAHDDDDDYNEHDDDDGGPGDRVAEETAPEAPKGGRATKKTRRKKKKKAAAAATPLTPKEQAQRERCAAERRQQERYVATLLAKIELHSAGLTEAQKQYRVNNTITMRDGRTITVRGPPKVSPIWFCASGDVYCDWTALPGGKRLQAHLSLLYERSLFVEYLQLLQMLLLRLYRRAAFGEETFSAGTFGLQERYGQTRVPPANVAKAQRARAEQRDTFTSAPPPPRSSSPSRPQAGDAWFDPLLRAQLSSPLRRQAQRNYEDQLQQLQTQQTQTEASASRPGTGGARTLREERLFSPGDPDHQRDAAEPLLTLPELRLLWRQLLMAAIAIGVLCTERGGALFDRGMDCFTLCDTWLRDFDELVPLRRDRRELKAFVQDAMAFYFFKRKRSLAARAFSEQAMALFRETQNAEMEAQCLLHIAAVQCQLSQFKESHATLFHFLAMVETGRLAFAQATPKQLCMVAVAYHNLAVVQLKLDAPDLACKSSQNARKIARLCLAQANRWIDVFQYTHEVALADMKYELSTRTLDEMTPQQILLVRELAEALFAPDVVISG